MFRTGTILAALAAVATMGSARAAQQWPASLAGFVGVGQSNETSLTIRIKTQAAAGTCKTITGTMVDLNSTRIDTIDGFYCPGSGRISFLRILPGKSAGFQAYLGNVSEAVSGNVAVAGVFAENSNNGALGEYPFGVQSQD